MAKDISKRMVIDAETGEVLMVAAENDVIRIYPQKKNSQKETEAIMSLSELGISYEHYLRMNVLEFALTANTMSESEIGFLVSLLPYMSYVNCLLCYKNGNELTADDMAEIVGASRPTVFNRLESLRKKDIIYRGKHSRGYQYFVNPWLFSKGSKFNSTLRTMFRNYRVKTRGNKKWSDL